MSMYPTVAYVLDPRFRGGTSSAVAAELDLVSGLARVEVHALSTAMFSGRSVAPQLGDALARLTLPLIWDAREIAADIVIFHNPSCLKFQDTLATRIVANKLIVVTHENFLRPGGAEGFDVAKCLELIGDSSTVLQRAIAPISPWNRQTVDSWVSTQSPKHDWAVQPWDWFNICSFEMQAPTPHPADRRGRHSRPGFEKFPQQDVMDLCFPEAAEQNVILGADSYLRDGSAPAHWTLYPFGGLSVSQYFEQIDFCVYYTAPTWRESFGRVLAEAIAAGKIAISDPQTAQTFDGAVIGAAPSEVNDIVRRYISDPVRYQRDVVSGQGKLGKFSSTAFEATFNTLLGQMPGGPR
ncbi:hypothetical protein KX928_14100 [Roseobacter sp. YSTF-M11]|uniref:Uncharacterized protein n=1 Tax=Roseobacter insulae TaxID=2859783 RepID=A0A9X1FX70_9RHOB|nr:hypothetical protein [Roseobacter insulae]MBW4708917.1 hypothetical protein [Roseobacter insulae]